jgi:HAD superfamily hydrolase (TIGR01484 family)
VEEVKYRFFKDNKKKIKENLKDLKVIYSDLDGTLLNDRGCIIKDHKSDYYFEAVRLLVLAAEKNWDIVLVSGRNKFQLRYNAQMIGLKNYIAELGAELVYDLGEEVHVTFDSRKENYDLTYGGKDLIRIIELFKKNFPDKIESNTDWSRYRSYNALFFGEINIEKANKLLKDEGYKGLVIVDNGFSSLINLELGIEKLHIYNLMPSGVNKASGIKLDKRIRNFDTKNCIALGDSLEDLKMADEVKYFFLMKNALAHKEVMLNEIRKHNNVFVTNDVMNRGWAEVIGYLVD